jgi:hypothetical protein
MKLKYVIPALLLTATMACNPTNQESKNMPGTQDQQKITTDNGKNGVYFVNLKDGDVVKSPVIVQMGVTGMMVEPAGTLNEGKGHHHLIVDGSYVEKGEMVMKDETHLHFGKGQTVDTLTLSPGQHTLTLQFADGMHKSYGKDWSNTIKITVQQ